MCVCAGMDGRGCKHVVFVYVFTYLDKSACADVFYEVWRTCKHSGKARTACVRLFVQVAESRRVDGAIALPTTVDPSHPRP